MENMLNHKHAKGTQSSCSQVKSNHTFLIRQQPPTSTVVFDTYWEFASRRQDTYFHRIKNHSISPQHKDPIISKYKFTNVYRASDRVSQYLIRNVIYAGSQDIEEIFFRTILFKLFNKIETWKLFENTFGHVTWSSFDLDQYDNILERAISSGVKIYSPAYIMPSIKSVFAKQRKHSNHLMLLKMMMKNKVPQKIQQCKTMKDAYELLISYPGLGPFLAYQYVIDLNYSTITEFSENDFVVPGPGAISGISKCFSDLSGWTLTDIIRYVTDSQEREFERMGLSFKNLWGRKLHLIDCQNVFCEVDKYARVYHPEFSAAGGRTRIKQVYKPTMQKISYWFPPKWGLNKKIRDS